MDDETQPGVLPFEEGVQLMDLPDEAFVDHLLANRTRPGYDVPQITKDDVRALLAADGVDPVLSVAHDRSGRMQLVVVQLFTRFIASYAVVITRAEMRVFLDAAGIDLDDDEADWGDLLLVLQERVDTAAGLLADVTTAAQPRTAPATAPVAASPFPRLEAAVVRALLLYPAVYPDSEGEPVLFLYRRGLGGPLTPDVHEVQFVAPKAVIITRTELVTFLDMIGIVPENYDTLDLASLMPVLQARAVKVAKAIAGEKAEA